MRRARPVPRRTQPPAQATVRAVGPAGLTAVLQVGGGTATTPSGPRGEGTVGPPEPLALAPRRPDGDAELSPASGLLLHISTTAWVTEMKKYGSSRLLKLTTGFA